MTNKSADVIIRLALKDDGVREALKATGKDGERALKKIDRAQKETSPGLKAIDGVAKDLKGSMAGLGDRLGPVGSGLNALGPIGFAAAAGLGAIVATLAVMNRMGQNSIDFFSEIGRSADNLGVSTTALSAWRFELAGLDVDLNSGQQALQFFQKTAGEAALGTGEFYTNLKQVSPELAEAVRNADTFEERLQVLKDGYNQTSSAAVKNTIETRAFGDNNVAVAKRILTSQNSVADVYDNARKAGVLASEEQARAAQEAAGRIEQANQRIEASHAFLGIQFQDVVVDMKESWADFLTFIGDFKTVEGDEGRLAQLDRLRQRELDKIEEARALNDRTGGNNLFSQQQIERSEQRIAAYDAEEAALRNVIAAQQERKLYQDIFFDVAQPETLNQSQIAEANRWREQIITLDQRRAEELKKLQDLRGKEGGLTESEYQAAVAQVNLRYRDVEAIAAQQRAEREKAAEITRIQSEMNRGRDQLIRELETREREATATLERAYTAGLSAAQAYARETENLKTLRKAANIEEERFNEIMAQRAKRQAELDKAESLQAERDRYGETLDEASARVIASLTDRATLIEQKVRAEKAILDALVARGDIDNDQATERLRRYREELERTTEQADLLDGVLNRQIRTVEDLGRAILEHLVSALERTARGKDGLSGGFFDRFLGNAGLKDLGVVPFLPDAQNDNSEELTEFTAGLAEASTKMRGEFTPSIAESILKTGQELTASQTTLTAKQLEVQATQRSTAALERFTRALNAATEETGGEGGGNDLLALASNFFGSGGGSSGSGISAATSNTQTALSALSQSAPSGGFISQVGLSGKSGAVAANVNIKIARSDGVNIDVTEKPDGQGGKELLIQARAVARSESAGFLADGGADKTMNYRFGARKTAVSR